MAAFLLLVPITGFGLLTAVIALQSSSTLLIIFRNVVAGLAAAPAEARDAALGMGLTDNQVLWRVEVPLALPGSSPGCASPPRPRWAWPRSRSSRTPAVWAG